MYFFDSLEAQLQQFIGVDLEIATDNALFEGIVVSVRNGVVELEETVLGYERANRFVIIPLSSINFIKVVL
ncbi:hypothetical protein H7K20_15450 [Priestia aryabhattai]|uniref:hypothetical protein n=1 Tax=Priestia aryabhattai TaxID=412384 RepID=UPI001C8D66C8|nr:hypothetical protein [Priestia aryabhattai]MBY0028500.1 hypothetical protein [Priestia aryabhattai]